MNGQDRTREQLIEELGQLRGMVAELRRENDRCKSEGQSLQSALQESERRFKALLYNLPEKVFHKDRESVYVSCNRNYAADCGLVPEQMVGKNDYDFFPRETAGKYRADDQRLMASGATEEIEESYYTRTGEERLIRTVKAPLRDEQGQVTGILGIFSDITERKRAEETLQKARDELERRVEERTAELTEANRQLQGEIEERERIEAALRQSEERYALAARGSGAGIWDWDLRTGKVYYSPRWKMLFGDDENEIGDGFEDWASRLHPDERESIIKRQADFLAGTSLTATAEYRLRHKDGSYRWIIAHVLVVRDAEGRACRLVGSHGDITDRKSAEEALRASEERFELVVRGSGVGIWDWDIRTGKVYYSPRWKMLFGYEEDQIGDGFEDWARLLHPDERELIIKFQEDFLAGTSPSVTAEYRLRHKDGSYRWIAAHAVVVRDEQGKAIRLVGSHGDITDRKQAEEALRQSEARYRALVESSPDAVAMCDLEGRVAFASERAAQQHGVLDPKELLGRPAADLVVQEDRERFRANTLRLIEEGIRRNDQYTGLRRDGTPFAAEVSSAIIRDAAGNPQALMGVYRDITERKQAEEALRESKERLQMALEVSRSFAFEWDVASDRVLRSDNCSRILGLSPSEAPYDTGQRFFQRIQDSDRDRFVRMLSELKPSARAYHTEYRVTRGDGATVVLEESACGFFDDHDMLCRLVGVTTDITDRKKAEAALRANYAELFAAAEIQDRLLPHEAPRVPGFDIAGQCFPAEAAAGDHFDFLQTPDGSLLLVMGDVSGHGIGPAIVAADFCARLRMLAETPCELPELAARVNAGLYRETEGEVFVTAFLGRLEPQSRTLTYVNAGHPSALVLNAAGEIKACLASSGIPFAIMPAAPLLANQSVELTDGDLLFIYTDGLAEVRRQGEPLFGIERALEIVRANLDRSADEIIETLHRAAYHYAGAEKPQDDITVIVVKVLPRTPDLSSDLRQRGDASTRPPAYRKRRRRRNIIGAAHFSAEQCDDTTIVRLVDTSRFHTDQYAQLQQDLEDFVERQQPRKLLVDLGNIEYGSSALISVLLIAQKRVEAGSGGMKLFGTREVVLEALQCLKLTGTMFSVYVDETAAKNAF